MRECSSRRAIPEALAAFCRDHAVSKVFFHREVELNERQRDEQALLLLKAEGIAAEAIDASTILPPGSVLGQNGRMPKVFTAFKRVWIREFLRRGLSLAPLETEGTKIFFSKKFFLTIKIEISRQ